MKRVVTIILSAASVFAATSSISAQDKAEFSVGADVVSSYVWRGVYQTGFSIQPSMDISYKGLSLGAWGSTDLDDFKEVDFSLGYSVRGLSLAVTDYWWDGQWARYGGDYKASHHFEVSLAYTLSESFPLTVSWSTFLMGDDYKASGKRAYSSYAELSYPFTISGVDITAAVGAAPWESPTWLMQESGFKVSNISVTASKAIQISDKFSLPVFGMVGLNPATEDIHLTFGVSF